MNSADFADFAEKVREIRGPRNEFDRSPRNEFLQKSAKSEVRGMNFYKSLQNPKFLGII